jgi:dihydrofolate synthase/folylpolyglutamate synthase
LNGEHQYKNAAVAVMALEVLRQYYALIVDDEVLVEALKSVRWPGRLEFVGERPRILLDGAHNPEGAATLAAALRSIRPAGSGKIRLMTAMMANKEHIGYFREVLPLVDSLIVTQVDFRNTLAAERLAEVVRKVQEEMGLEFDLAVEPDWRAALAQLQRQTDDGDLAVVSGTLYMISDVRCALLGQSTSEKGW